MSQESPKPANSNRATNSGKSAETTSTQRSRLQALRRMAGQLWEIVLAFVPLAWNGLQRLGQFALKFLKWLQQWWAATLPKLRTRLPEPWKTSLPDAAITAMAIVLLVLLLWVPVSLLPHSTTSPATASLERPTEQPPANEKPISPAKAAKAEKPVDPERIAAIQNQMAEVSAEYAAELIEAVQANFSRSRLVINVNQSWYGLSETQQEQLANELLNRAKKLSFKTIEINTLDGKLLARNAVVGTGMVVLASTKPA